MEFFNYAAPKTLQEAYDLLENYGDNLCPLAGGTDLLPQVRSGKFAPQMVMDIKHIPQLMEVSRTNDKITVGAGVPCFELYENSDFKRAYPGIVDSLTILGGIQIQSRAGMGGNLCNSSPSADTICPLIVHDAVAQIASKTGTRAVAVNDFCTAPSKNIMTPQEMLVAIEIPTNAVKFGAAYQRFTPRNEMDIAVVGVAVAVTLSASLEQFEQVKIALAGVAPTPLVATQAEAALRGAKVSKATINTAAELAASETKPIDDMRGSIEHRRQLVATLVRRVTNSAIDRFKNR